MQHFTTWSASSTFVCGADAVGRRNSRNDVNPTLTECYACKNTEVWTEAYTVWVAATRSRACWRTCWTSTGTS
jgi:hypothetical protein